MQDISIPFVSTVRNEQAMRADSMAKKLLSNNAINFWKEVRVLNNRKTFSTISGTDNIVEL